MNDNEAGRERADGIPGNEGGVVMTTDAARLAAIRLRLFEPGCGQVYGQVAHDAAAVLELVTALEHARIAIQGVRDAGVEHMGFLSSEVVQHIDKALARYAPEVTK